MTDPRIVDNPKVIKTITYRELRELAYMGATVLHEDSIFTVFKAGIPINIKNTNAPSAPGTMIIPDTDDKNENGYITGIAGKKKLYRHRHREEQHEQTRLASAEKCSPPWRRTA